MFSKLLKHEFRATGRILLPVYLLPLVTAILLNLQLNLGSDVPGRTAGTFLILNSILFTIALIGAGVMTVVLMVYRFYRNYMCDEGYLMFTLPVSTHQLILSKLLTAVVWEVVYLLVSVVAVCLLLVGKPWGALGPDLQSLWDQLFSTVSGWQIAGEIVKWSVFILLGTLASFLVFYAAIAVGHGFSNHKILLSVVFYFGFTTIIQMVISFSMAFGVIDMQGLMEESTTLSGFFDQYVLFLAPVYVLEIVIFYSVTYLNLKRRLNLQ